MYIYRIISVLSGILMCQPSVLPFDLLSIFVRLVRSLSPSDLLNITNKSRNKEITFTKLLFFFRKTCSGIYLRLHLHCFNGHRFHFDIETFSFRSHNCDVHIGYMWDNNSRFWIWISSLGGRHMGFCRTAHYREGN